MPSSLSQVLSLDGLVHQLQAAYGLWRTDAVQIPTAIVGSLGLAVALYKAVTTGYNVFLKPSQLHRYRHCPEGSWALVTGATDGIGRGFAESLLERGFNVLLHGRNPEKLERVRAELAAAFPTRQLATVIADASAPDDSYQKVATAAQSLPGGGKLTVLINNVGGVPFARGIAPHSTLDAATVDGILHLNARFPTQLTRALLPTLSAHAPALVLSCSSLAGLQAMPYLAVYGSTKAYIDGFTRGLRADQAAARVLAAAGDKSAPVPAADVEVVGAWIGNVLSGGNKTDVPFFTMTSKQCADACLGRVGSGHALTFPSWRVAMMLALTQVLPQKMQDDITTKSMQERYLSQEKNV